MELTPDEQRRQELYRDARFTKQYDGIWQDVGKCVFCDLSDKYILMEEHGVVLTISLFAYIDGHLMIIPRRHVRSAKELTELEWDTIRRFTYIAKNMVKDVHGIKGIQFVLRDGGIVAQSTVSDHLHFHAIPFDAPDLSVWNYRQLKHTPLENAELYRRHAPQIARYDSKFTSKYAGRKILPLVADALIVNERRQILFQERAPFAKMSPDYLTIPGGIVDDFSVRFEVEVAREVLEETGAVIDPAALHLVDSRISTIDAVRDSKYLGLKYTHTRRFFWNTYLLTGFDSATPLQAADDVAGLLWIDIETVAGNPRISEGIQDVIAKVKL